MVYRTLIAVCAFVALTGTSSVVWAGADSAKCEPTFLSFERELASNVNETRRGDVAERLATYVQQNHDCGRSRIVVSGLIALLSDRNDSVRWGAAESLANISPRPKQAVPALEMALRESDADLDKLDGPFLPTRYSGEAIRQALRKITKKRIPEYYETH